MADRYVHIVWASATGPIAIYENPSLAFSHARSMSGVEVTSLKIRTSLPSIVLDDLGQDFEEDDNTPLDSPAVAAPARTDDTNTVVIACEDLDDS